MKIFKQAIAIIAVSFVCGISFNIVSPHGIDILNNPWSKRVTADPAHLVEHGAQAEEDGPIIFIGLDRVCRFIENGEGIVLDARNSDAYAEGHIPGAYLLNLYKMNEYYPKLEDQLQTSSAILVYCGDIHCEDSEFLANELVNLGYAPIFVYKGGFEEWKANQLPIEKGGRKGNG